MAQLTFNVSLGLTSVTSNTILSSTSALFTYAAGIALHLEAWKVQKLGAISLCMAGMLFCEACACWHHHLLWEYGQPASAAGHHQAIIAVMHLVNDFVPTLDAEVVSRRHCHGDLCRRSVRGRGRPQQHAGRSAVPAVSLLLRLVHCGHSQVRNAFSLLAAARGLCTWQS